MHKIINGECDEFIVFIFDKHDKIQIICKCRHTCECHCTVRIVFKSCDLWNGLIMNYMCALYTRTMIDDVIELCAYYNISFKWNTEMCTPCNEADRIDGMPRKKILCARNILCENR